MQRVSVNKEILLKKITTSMSFIFLSSISSICFSQTMIPLEKFISERNLNDPSEFAYVGQRCSSLFNVVSGVFRENGSSKNAQTITNLENKSDVMRNISLRLDLGVNKKSEESIINQSKQFIQIYSKQLVKNKQMNNNYFDGYIKTDLEVCNSIYPTFEQLNKKVSN